LILEPLGASARMTWLRKIAGTAELTIGAKVVAAVLACGFDSERGRMKAGAIALAELGALSRRGFEIAREELVAAGFLVRGAAAGVWRFAGTPAADTAPGASAPSGSSSAAPASAHHAPGSARHAGGGGASDAPEQSKSEQAKEPGAGAPDDWGKIKGFLRNYRGEAWLGWLKNVEVSRIEDGRIELVVPNAFVREYLSRNGGSILKAATIVSGRNVHRLELRLRR
jgi:hypothetical protein